MKRTSVDDKYVEMIEGFEGRIVRGDFSLTQEEYCELTSLSMKFTQLAKRYSECRSIFLQEQMPDEVWVVIFQKIGYSISAYASIRRVSKEWYRCIGKMRHMKFTRSCEKYLTQSKPYLFLESAFIYGGWWKVNFSKIICLKKLKIGKFGSEVMKEGIPLLTNLTSLSGEGIFGNILRDLPEKMKTSITRLGRVGEYITIEDISQFTNLTSLNLMGNEDKIKEFSPLTKLTRLKALGRWMDDINYTGYAEIQLGNGLAFFKGHLSGGKLDSKKEYKIQYHRGIAKLEPTAKQHWDQLRGLLI